MGEIVSWLLRLTLNQPTLESVVIVPCVVFVYLDHVSLGDGIRADLEVTYPGTSLHQIRGL